MPLISNETNFIFKMIYTHILPIFIPYFFLPDIPVNFHLINMILNQAGVIYATEEMKMEVWKIMCCLLAGLVERSVELYRHFAHNDLNGLAIIPDTYNAENIRQFPPSIYFVNTNGELETMPNYQQIIVPGFVEHSAEILDLHYQTISDSDGIWCQGINIAVLSAPYYARSTVREVERTSTHPILDDLSVSDGRWDEILDDDDY